MHVAQLMPSEVTHNSTVVDCKQGKREDDDDIITPCPRDTEWPPLSPQMLTVSNPKTAAIEYKSSKRGLQTRRVGPALFKSGETRMYIHMYAC